MEATRFTKTFSRIYLTFYHTNILLFHWEIAFTNNFLYGSHKIHKNLLGDIPNIFSYQHFILSLRNCNHKQFCIWYAHKWYTPGLKKYTKTFSWIYVTFSHTNTLLSHWEIAFTNNFLLVATKFTKIFSEIYLTFYHTNNLLPQ